MTLIMKFQITFLIQKKKYQKKKKRFKQPPKNDIPLITLEDLENNPDIKIPLREIPKPIIILTSCIRKIQRRINNECILHYKIGNIKY